MMNIWDYRLIRKIVVILKHQLICH